MCPPLKAQLLIKVHHESKITIHSHFERTLLSLSLISQSTLSAYHNSIELPFDFEATLIFIQNFEKSLDIDIAL